MIYPGSDIRLFNLPLESIAPGTVAQEYSYTATPPTGGDSILTDDPAGQVLHFACNRDVGLYRRVMVDGQFGPPVLVTGLPLLNGFSIGWKDGVLHLLGYTWPSGPTVHYKSTDWGLSFTYVETLPQVLGPNRQVVTKDGVNYHPVHYALPSGRVVSGMWSIPFGLQGAIDNSQGNVGLVEPALGMADGAFLMVGRTEDTVLALPLSQTLLPHTPAVPMFVLPVLRVGGSPPCLVQDGDTPILGYAPSAGLGTGPPYWNIYTTMNGLTWNLLCQLDADEPNYDGLRDAHRYMTMLPIYDQDDNRWLLVCAGEPDNATRPAQEVKLNLDALQGVRLQGSGVAGLSCPSGDVVCDWWIHKDTVATGQTYITVGSATQVLGGFMINGGGQCFSWPSAQYLNKDFTLGLRHKKGKRLGLKRKGTQLQWYINGLLVHEEIAPIIEPTQWRFSGSGGYILTSLRVSSSG